MPGPSQQAGGMPGCVGLLIASDLQRTLGSVTPSRTTGQATEAHSHTTFVALSPSGRPLLTATDTRALRMLRHRGRSRSPVRMRSSAWRRSPRSSDWIAGFPTTLSAGNSGRMHSGTVDLSPAGVAPSRSTKPLPAGGYLQNRANHLKTTSRHSRAVTGGTAMARPDVSELYSTLKADEFAMLGTGTYSLHDVYRAVRRRHPDLCDDTFLCRENCRNGHDQPEWQHVVRKALDSLKRRNASRVTHVGPAQWSFE